MKNAAREARSAAAIGAGSEADPDAGLGAGASAARAPPASKITESRTVARWSARGALLPWAAAISY